MDTPAPTDDPLPGHPRWHRAAIALALLGLLLLVGFFACRAPEDDAGPSAVTPTPTTPSATPTAPESTSTPSPTPTPIPPTPTPSPTPAVPTPAADLVALQQALQEEIDGYWQDGVYAFAVTDLQTGETISVYGGRQQLSACVMNLFVLLRATLDVQEGRLSVADIDELMAATTWSSNATTARELYRIAGAGDIAEGVRRVGALLQELWMEHSVIDHPPAFAESIGVSEDNWVTAEDVNRALVAIWSGDLLGPEWRDYLLAHLHNVKPGLNYLVASVPGNVSHKNGFFPGGTGYVDNDAGIVRFTVGGREYAFAVTFLSQEVPVKYEISRSGSASSG
ncbi:MAG: serine hydrolase [Hyphomicrobiales bacterium]